MTIAQGALHLVARQSSAPLRSIDHFFRSLAEDQAQRAIGVVLSGTASDGTLGLSAIKAEGGLTFAQDDSAQQTGMPHSAIAEGSVDFVLAPGDIAHELTRLARHPRLTRALLPVDAEGDRDLRQVLSEVRQGTGVDFTHYKANTLQRRIMRRMILRRTQNLKEYAQVLRKTPAEVDALQRDLLIGVTSFFRDPAAYEQLKATVLPRLMAADLGHPNLRFWVLGCSTGQEAYSLAIAFAEVAETLGRRVPVQIFASDANATAVETARTGTYPKEIAQDVSPERLRRFFMEVDGHYRVIKSIRDSCVFSRHNALSDPPFSRMDLISCRNMMMYLEPVLQQRVMALVHYALKPGGILWLGSAETVGSQRELFDAEDVKHKIFVKRPGSTALAGLLVPQRPAGAPEPGATSLELRDGAEAIRESDRLLLARFAPAGVLVSANMDIVQFRGDIGPFVSPAPGKASLNLLKMLGNGLQVAVRTAVARAKRDETAVREDAVQVSSRDGDRRTVSIEVIPVNSGQGGFLVLFEESGAGRAHRPNPNPRPHKPQTGQEAADEQIARLAKELADTRGYLQSIIEQQEAAHEELQSANEEVQSANEELQSINEELETSKEEIQSSNEELSTVNDELQYRNAEISRTNGDLINLLTSTEQAVIFLGRDLRVRRYTPTAETVVGLIAADVGRPLRDLRLKLVIPELEHLLVAAIEKCTLAERDVQDDKGRWYSLRVRPYRTLDNQVDGAVLVVVDVDALVRGRLYAESIIATVREPLVVLDEDTRVVTANAAFYRTFGSQSEETEGRSLYELSNRQWDLPTLRTLLEQLPRQENASADLEIDHDFQGIGRKAMILKARRVVRGGDEQALVLLAIEDVTERHRVESLRNQRAAELLAADQSKNEFLAMLAHELRNPLAPIRTAAQILGRPGIAAPLAERSRAIVDRQVQNMTRLIDDLLDVARITQNKIEVRMAPTDLTAVLRRVVEVVEQLVGERDQALSTALPSESWYVHGDATRLEQAFGNLLNNASKFTAQSGHLSLTAEKRDVADGRAEAVVRVRDDGIGIAPEMVPVVFDLFKQAGQSPHHTPGLGVGLALAHRIVALHGGRLDVESAGVNRGSEFIVSLPLLGMPTADAVDTSSRDEQVTDGVVRRILVVDDNVDAADSLGTLLRLAGHEVRVVHDGRGAVDAAAEFLPEVVLLDIAMPDMDGYDVARRLRQLAGGETALIVAVTGFGRDEDRRRAKAAGFDLHVTKPLDPARLAALLNSRR